MLSESIWKKQNSILEQDANNISILKKQINKQTEIDASVQLSITEKIQNLKQNATLLAKKLENEKHKNHQLESIIKYLKDQMETQKLQEASFRDNINSQNLASLDNKLKKLQYDLGHINSKTNRIAENVEQKKSKISQNRTERVIDSGIFRNIEKELSNSELTFKKLLIEKVKYQKEYQKLIQQYDQLKLKAEEYVSKDISKIKSLNESNALQQKQNEQILNAINKFKKIQSRRETKGRALTIKCDNQIDYNDEKEMVSIKKLLSRTGLTSTSELVYLFENVNEINQKYYNEMNNYVDQINQVQRYLAQSKQVMKGKTNFYAPLENQDKKVSKEKIIKQRKEQLKEVKAETQKQLEGLFTFFESENLIKLAQQTNIQLPSVQQKCYTNSEALVQTLQLFQKNIQQLIYCENQKEEKKTLTKSKSNDLQEMINRVKKNEEFSKVMKKEDFQEQYHKIVKNLSQKNLTGTRPPIKKKSFGFTKK